MAVELGLPQTTVPEQSWQLPFAIPDRKVINVSPCQGAPVVHASCKCCMTRECKCICRYAYLLDEKGRIRWRASGHAQPDELQSMLTASEELVYSHSKV